MYQKGSCLAIVKMHELNLTTVTTAILHSKDGNVQFPNGRLKFLLAFLAGNKTIFDLLVDSARFCFCTVFLNVSTHLAIFFCCHNSKAARYCFYHSQKFPSNYLHYQRRHLQRMKNTLQHCLFRHIKMRSFSCHSRVLIPGT